MSEGMIYTEEGEVVAVPELSGAHGTVTRATFRDRPAGCPITRTYYHYNLKPPEGLIRYLGETEAEARERLAEITAS